MRRAKSFCARLAQASGPLVLGLALWQPAWGVEPRVAGLNELVIYDPGEHERGLPGVTFDSEEGETEIDIAPIVHVHRYYYSGNKEFQGPIIAGGPTIVVANNPHTGERMYIDVMLPPGAPIIEYDKSKITYNFPDRRVCICFSRIFDEHATVKYISGKGLARAAQEHTEKVKEETKKQIKSSALAGALKEAACDVKKAAVGAVGVAEATATAAVETGQKIIRVIPGVQMLQSAGEQARERGETEALKQAGKARAFAESESIRTVR